MKELVELIAKALVDNPDKVQVSQLDGEQTSILELKVAPEDIGKVIGKQGGLFKQAYAVEKTKTEARLKGYSVLERQTDSGIRLHVRIS